MSCYPPPPISMLFCRFQIHREIGGTVIRRFVNQELAKQGKMSAQGVAFLANINSRLNMPQDVSRYRFPSFFSRHSVST